MQIPHSTEYFNLIITLFLSKNIHHFSWWYRPVSHVIGGLLEAIIACMIFGWRSMAFQTFSWLRSGKGEFVVWPSEIQKLKLVLWRMRSKFTPNQRFTGHWESWGPIIDCRIHWWERRETRRIPFELSRLHDQWSKCEQHMEKSYQMPKRHIQPPETIVTVERMASLSTISKLPSKIWAKKIFETPLIFNQKSCKR